MPGGRPKGSKTINSNKPWSDALNLALNDYGTKAGQKVKKLRLVADACIDAALNGDISAIKEIGDRIEGKAPQGLIHSGDENSPLKHVVELSFRSGV